MTDRPPPTRVLFVCMGNICRSPLAEAIFRHRAATRGVAERFLVDSAGTGDWHVGEAPDERVQHVAARNGVWLDSAARQVKRGDFKRFDHIFCMDEDNREALLEMGAPAGKVRLLLECDPRAPMVEVPDPYFGGEDGFDLVWRLVDSACDAVLDELLDEHPSGGTKRT
ncbi:MAG: low molecular weight protein-tyrosine-phosphatase [Planctomycetota bacterium]|nr:low molecular weight protein-tyrosine-phosphatase [Planctomycetota bacterium]